MHLVIADAGPINYLVLIRQAGLLPRLFERIVLPSAVRSELSDNDAPPEVQAWIEDPPAWLEIVDAPLAGNAPGIHKGEAAAIALARSMRADLLLMHDRRGVRLARAQGLRVTGTLGLLDVAVSPYSEPRPVQQEVRNRDRNAIVLLSQGIRSVATC